MQRLVYLLLLLNLQSFNCFMGKWPGTVDHVNITYSALQNVLVSYFNKIPLPSSKPVTVGMPLVDIFANYYGRPVPVMDFLSAASTIYWSNVNTDSTQSTGYNADYHFDAERISATNQRLIESRQNLVKVIQNHDFDSARTNLGQILHTIQDFYSHSNWVEMGNTQPNAALGAAGQDIGETAGPDQQTCTNCDGNTCQNNIITSINSAGLLTSGYFYRKGADEGETDDNGDHLNKPVGKCSHGGSLDASSTEFPTGGINKDTPFPQFSPHYNLHGSASFLAFQATVNYLNDLWITVGDDDFARLLNLKLSAALAIVIDTTGSMQPYIEAVKLRCQEIILAAAGSIFQPSEYILVPFNDPEYGPVYTTADPNQMIAWINSLTADGGGDFPEMCFHGLQLAEQASPYGTPIFVFTDATPKDGELFLDVLTLALSDDLTINFCGANLGDDDVSLKAIARKGNNNGVKFDVGSEEDVGTFQMYDELAAATGGYVLTTTSDTGNIFNSTAFIDSMLLSSTVNLFQMKNQSGNSVFNIPVDQTMGSFSIMLTSAYTLNVGITLTSPNGTLSSYSLLTDTTTTKYLQVTPVQPGLWTFNVSTTNTNFFISIHGQSVWDTLLTLTQFDFISPHPSYQVITGNPIAMSNVTLFVTPASDKVIVNEVHLIEATSGKFLFGVSTHRNINESCYLAEFMVPNNPFYIITYGRDQKNNQAIRTSTQIFIPSTIEISAAWNGNSTSSIQPGQSLQVSFNVTNLGSNNSFNIIVTDSLSLMTSYTPHSMTLHTGTSGEGFITLYANTSIAPGSVSILQVIVQVDGSELNNFLHMLIYVVPVEYDIYPPDCIILDSNINISCPLTNANCEEYYWNASVVFSDHGSGLYRTSTISYGGNVTWYIEPFPQFLQDTNVSASAFGDCCFQNTTLVIVDGVGLTGSCFLSNHRLDTTTAPKLTTQIPFDCTNKANGDYINPSHPCAQTYYTCSNGYTYLMHCPSNLYFDQDQDKCLGKSDVPQCN